MQILTEWEYLIHLISCAVHSKQPFEKPDNISFEDVLECGILHEVANIAYLSVIKLKNKPSAETLKKWQDFYYAAVKRDVFQSEARNELISLLNSKNIPILELQGSAVKKYYPSPDLRMMSDIDIIIPEDKLKDAEEILKKLGYETKYSGLELDASNQIGINFELHTQFFAPNGVFFNILKNPFDYAVEKDGAFSVSDTTFYLFNLLHSIKHYIGSGLGLRRIIDLYYLKREFSKKVDTDYIEKVLSENGLKKAYDEIDGICDYWLCGKNSDTDFSEISQKIKDAGNHGSSINKLKNRIYEAWEKPRNFSVFRQLISSFFVSKENIYYYYPFTKRHHYPLFLCRIHRAACIIFLPKGRKMLKDYLHKLKTIKKETKKSQ